MSQQNLVWADELRNAMNSELKCTGGEPTRMGSVKEPSNEEIQKFLDELEKIESLFRKK